MVFAINYLSQNGNNEQIEWITDGDGSWTADSVAECFRRRFPNATLLSCTLLCSA